jgi:hypothetical protein
VVDAWEDCCGDPKNLDCCACSLACNILTSLTGSGSVGS